MLHMCSRVCALLLFLLLLALADLFSIAISTPLWVWNASSKRFKLYLELTDQQSGDIYPSGNANGHLLADGRCHRS